MNCLLIRQGFSTIQLAFNLDIYTALSFQILLLFYYFYSHTLSINLVSHSSKYMYMKPTIIAKDQGLITKLVTTGHGLLRETCT